MRSASISPSGMTSISVMSMPRPWAQAIMSGISSALTSRSATALILTFMPAARAAAMPSSTTGRSPRRVIARNLSGSSVSSETLIRRTPRLASSSA